MFTKNQLTETVRALNYLLANADLTAAQWRDAQAAASCIRSLITADMIAVYWTTDDVKSLVDEDDEADGVPPLTDDETRAVLKSADEYHDANIGINWDVLSTHLDMLREEKAGQASE